MNIYFACSITGGREFEAVFQTLVNIMLANGHTVPTAMLATPAVRELEVLAQPREVYQRDITWLENADVLVAEVSTPSHGVGYEIGYALGLSKPVLCLHQKGRTVSKMITGNSHPLLRVAPYETVAQAEIVLMAYLSELQLL